MRNALAVAPGFIWVAVLVGLNAGAAWVLGCNIEIAFTPMLDPDKVMPCD